MATTGTATVDFGSVSGGTQRAVVTVTGQSGIAADSFVEAWLMGDSTAKHNAYEHSMVPMLMRPGNIVPGASFDIVCTCDWKLTGTFALRWVWT